MQIAFDDKAKAPINIQGSVAVRIGPRADTAAMLWRCWLKQSVETRRAVVVALPFSFQKAPSCVVLHCWRAGFLV